MKTKSVLSIILFLLLSIPHFVSASEPMTSEVDTEFGKKVTVTTFAEDSGILDKRTESNYNHDGVLFERVAYRWQSYDGWQPVSKQQYSYNNDGVLAEIATVSWNHFKKCWDTKPSVRCFEADGKLRS